MDQFSNILLSGLFRGISLLIPAGPSSASDSDRGYTNSRTEVSFISLMTFMLASQQLKNYVALAKLFVITSENIQIKGIQCCKVLGKGDSSQEFLRADGSFLSGLPIQTLNHFPLQIKVPYWKAYGSQTPLCPLAEKAMSFGQGTEWSTVGSNSKVYLRLINLPDLISSVLAHSFSVDTKQDKPNMSVSGCDRNLIILSTKAEKY